MTGELATSVCRGRGTIRVKALHDGSTQCCSREQADAAPRGADVSTASSPNQRDCVSDSGQSTQQAPYSSEGIYA